MKAATPSKFQGAYASIHLGKIVTMRDCDIKENVLVASQTVQTKF